jgi:hypothetical protein
MSEGSTPNILKESVGVCGGGGDVAFRACLRFLRVLRPREPITTIVLCRASTCLAIHSATSFHRMTTTLKANRLRARSS